MCSFFKFFLHLVPYYDFFPHTSFATFLLSMSCSSAMLVLARSCLLLSQVFELPGIVFWPRFPEQASSSKCLLLSASSPPASAWCWSSSLSPLHKQHKSWAHVIWFAHRRDKMTYHHVTKGWDGDHMTRMVIFIFHSRTPEWNFRDIRHFSTACQRVIFQNWVVREKVVI